MPRSAVELLGPLTSVLDDWLFYLTGIFAPLLQVMRVIIFDQLGNVLNKFGCSKHLEFPNGVVVNDR